jgi:hypothetical protein
MTYEQYDEVSTRTICPYIGVLLYMVSYIMPTYRQVFRDMPVLPRGFCSQLNPATGMPFTSCSAAVAGTQKSNITNVALYNLWTKLPFTFGNSLLSQQQANSLFMETSLGWGNYNAAIVSLTPETKIKLQQFVLTAIQTS